jgi:O-antigen ligase
MATLLYFIILISAFTVFVLLFLKRQQTYSIDQRISILTIFFSGWLISSVFFGPEFLVIQAPFFFDVTIERVIFFIIILTTSVGFIKNIQKKTFSKHSFEILMGLFAIICLISMIRKGFFSPIPEFPSPWFVFITAYFFPFIVFYFSKTYLTKAIDIKFVFNVIFFIGVYLSITALFEFYALYHLVYPQYIADPEIILHFGQARGPFLNSPHLGVAVLFGLACGLHLVSYKKRLSKFFFVILFLIFPMAVFFTQTRAIYLSLVVLFFILLILYKTYFPKWKVAALPVVIILITFFALLPLLAQEDRRAGGVVDVETVEIRQGLTQMSLIMFKDQPLLGVGLSQFLPQTVTQYKGRVPRLDRYQELIYIHNHILGMTVELGIIGAFIYLSIVFLMFKRLLELRKYLVSSTQFVNTNFLVITASIWIIFLVSFNFSSPEFEIFPNAVIFMLAGIVDGLYQRYRQLDFQPTFENGQERLTFKENPA